MHVHGAMGPVSDPWIVELNRFHRGSRKMLATSVVRHLRLRRIVSLDGPLITFL